MSYPELYSDERVVLQAQNVKVKSVSFEVVLTTRRLVLIDTKKNSIPPQEINLATLKDVESGENAIRDPTITISIITISGNTRQMVLPIRFGRFLPRCAKIPTRGHAVLLRGCRAPVTILAVSTA